jgi:hypothetical protein
VTFWLYFRQARRMAAHVKTRSVLLAIGICAVLGLAVWSVYLRHRSFLDLEVGNQAVAGVESSGFYQDEQNNEGPFRWTAGNAKLVMSLDRTKLPQAAVINLEKPRNRSLRITFNGHVVANEPATFEAEPFWERTFDLKSMDLGERLVVEITSNAMLPDNADRRLLGVKVRAVRVLRD